MCGDNHKVPRGETNHYISITKPFVGHNVTITRLEGQFDWIVWIVEVEQEKCLLTNYQTQLCVLKERNELLNMVRNYMI